MPKEATGTNNLFSPGYYLGPTIMRSFCFPRESPGIANVKDRLPSFLLLSQQSPPPCSNKAESVATRIRQRSTFAPVFPGRGKNSAKDGQRPLPSDFPYVRTACAESSYLLAPFLRPGGFAAGTPLLLCAKTYIEQRAPLKRREPFFAAIHDTRYFQEMQWVFLCFQKYNNFSFAPLTNRFQKGTIPINAAAFIKKYGGFDMNILAIGNSFSQDATAMLMDLAGQAGRPLAVCNLYIGGCSLEQHLCNAALNRMGYDLQENGQSTGRTVSIKEALSLKRWDWITMQQASHFSAFYERYQPWAKSLAAYVRHWAPEARLAVHQTWAYQAGQPAAVRHAFCRLRRDVPGR